MPTSEQLFLLAAQEVLRNQIPVLLSGRVTEEEVIDKIMIVKDLLTRATERE